MMGFQGGWQTISLVVLAGAWAGPGCVKADEESDRNPSGKEGALEPASPAAAAKGPGPRVQPPTLAPATRKIVVATVNGEVITHGELHDRMHRMSVLSRRRYVTLARKREYLERELILPALELAEAKRRRLDRDDAVRRAVKEAKRSGLARKQDVVRVLNQAMIQRLRQVITQAAATPGNVTQAAIKSYYDEHRAQYNKPRAVRVSHLLLADRATARRMLAELKAEGRDPRAFRRLAQQHSLDVATRHRGGDLGIVSRDDKRVDANVLQAALRMTRLGELAGPIKGAAGWHILKLTHRREAVSTPASDPNVQKQIRTLLLRGRRRGALEAFRKRLRAAARVTIDDARLAAVQIDTTLRTRNADRLPPRGRFRNSYP